MTEERALLRRTTEFVLERTKNIDHPRETYNSSNNARKIDVLLGQEQSLIKMEIEFEFVCARHGEAGRKQYVPGSGSIGR